MVGRVLIDKVRTATHSTEYLLRSVFTEIAAETVRNIYRIVDKCIGLYNENANALNKRIQDVLYGVEMHHMLC